MQFIPYPSIPNLYNAKKVVKEVEEQAVCQEFYVTEKIHGANFGIYCDGVEIRCASRSGFIEYGQKFNNYQNIMDKYRANLIKFADRHIKDFKSFGLTGLGMYATKPFCREFNDADPKIKNSVSWVRDQLESTYDERLQPAPSMDYELTFGSDPYHDQLEKCEDKPHEAYYKLRHENTTNYGCESAEYIFNVWLSGNTEYIKHLVAGLYQLVEIAIDEADCFIMKNQIMYNKNGIIAVEILDIGEVFSAIARDHKVAA